MQTKKKIIWLLYHKIKSSHFMGQDINGQKSNALVSWVWVHCEAILSEQNTCKNLFRIKTISFFFFFCRYCLPIIIYFVRHHQDIVIFCYRYCYCIFNVPVCVLKRYGQWKVIVRRLRYVMFAWRRSPILFLHWKKMLDLNLLKA